MIIVRVNQLIKNEKLVCCVFVQSDVAEQCSVGYDLYCLVDDWYQLIQGYCQIEAKQATNLMKTMTAKYLRRKVAHYLAVYKSMEVVKSIHYLLLNLCLFHDYL